MTPKEIFLAGFNAGIYKGKYAEAAKSGEEAWKTWAVDHLDTADIEQITNGRVNVTISALSSTNAGEESNP